MGLPSFPIPFRGGGFKAPDEAPGRATVICPTLCWLLCFWIAGFPGFWGSVELNGTFGCCCWLLGVAAPSSVGGCPALGWLCFCFACCWLEGFKPCAPPVVCFLSAGGCGCWLPAAAGCPALCFWLGCCWGFAVLPTGIGPLDGSCASPVGCWLPEEEATGWACCRGPPGVAALPASTRLSAAAIHFFPNKSKLKE